MERNNETIESLSKCWHSLKAKEKEIYSERVKLEEKIIDILGASEEGSKTHKINSFRVKITSRMNRKLDEKIWNEIKDSIPEDISPVKYKPTLSNTKLKEMILADPSAYRRVCKAVTSTPAKINVSIELAETK